MALLLMTAWAALLGSSTAQGVVSSLGFAGGLPQDIFGVSDKEQKFLSSGFSANQDHAGILLGVLGKPISENSFRDFSNGALGIFANPGAGGALSPFTSDFGRGPVNFFGSNDNFRDGSLDFNGRLPGSFLDFSDGLSGSFGGFFEDGTLPNHLNPFINGFGVAPSFGINDNSFETFSGNNIPLLGGFVSSLNGPGGSFGGLRGSEGFVSNLPVSSGLPRTTVGNGHFIAFETPSGVILIPSAALA
nr:uncharacterized protein LOC123753195 [Procambarus clarkii]